VPFHAQIIGFTWHPDGIPFVVARIRRLERVAVGRKNNKAAAGVGMDNPLQNSGFAAWLIIEPKLPKRPASILPHIQELCQLSSN
jgi:hypothetical protein